MGLRFLARPRGSCESMITIELADDSDDTIDGLEVRTRCGVVHRGERHEQRFVETADLKREEFGWRLRQTLRENLANDVAHPFEGKALAGRDLRDRSAAIEEAHDPLVAADLFALRGSSYSRRPAPAGGGGRRSFGIGCRSCHRNKYRTFSAARQENVCFSKISSAPRDEPSQSGHAPVKRTLRRCSRP
jgi:hypothetical protein